MESNGAPTDAAAAAAPVVKLRVSYGGGFVLGEFFATMDVSFLFLRSLSSSRNPTSLPFAASLGSLWDILFTRSLLRAHVAQARISSFFLPLGQRRNEKQARHGDFVSRDDLVVERVFSSFPLTRFFFQIKKTPTLFQLSNRPRRPLALHGRLHLPRVHPFHGVRLRRARLPPHGKGRQRGLDQVPAPRGAARPGRPDLGRRRRRRARAVRRVLPRGFLFLG